ncbi:hypothetical protein GJU94_13155 [Brucella sp. 10RB9214]|uniref:hypothetical protein n=1 Tax=unclassified Brucella TaxID=2632610 RepID=UPI0012AE4D9B|nr:MULTISPECIES: hypothetical protein [unclassified Brucella]MRN50768.1 hypothetical protein [Brucella sp. 10RB9214]
MAELTDVDNLADLAGLMLAARQILQTDANGALKAVALDANKALTTDANGDVAQVDLGTLGRALLALDSGNNKQLLRGDGTLGGEVFGTSANGGCLWPNGELEQWGFIETLDANGGASVVYPRPFSAVSVFIPTILTGWGSSTYMPVVYQSWEWGENILTGTTLWCRLINGTGGSGPLTSGNIRWYARGKA